MYFILIVLIFLTGCVSAIWLDGYCKCRNKKMIKNKMHFLSYKKVKKLKEEISLYSFIFQLILYSLTTIVVVFAILQVIWFNGYFFTAFLYILINAYGTIFILGFFIVMIFWDRRFDYYGKNL